MKATTIKNSILLFIFIQIAGISLFGQTNTVYIDPQYTGVKSGTISQPFTTWTDLTWKDGYSYLVKAGSIMDVNYKIRPTANRITIGSYGTGNRPLIRSSVNGDKVFDLGSLSDIVIRDLEVESTNNAITCFHFFTSVRGTLINCKIHGSEWGVRNVSSTGLFRIINCEIYMTQDDGCFNSTLDSIEVAGTYIHDVNQKYFVNTSETYSGGDCLQLCDVKYFNLHDNTLDHSATGNKFCIIANSSIAGFVAHGFIERNHFIRDKSNILIYLDFADKVLVRYNRFENGGIAIYNHSSNLQVYYNEFINITNILFCGGGPKGSDTRYINNTFYNVNIMIQSWTENVTFQNNIVYHCYGKMFDGSTNIVPNYNCYYKSASTSNLGANSIQADPQFNDSTKLDLSLKNTSPCIDKGNNVWSAYNDIGGIAVPSGSSADIGSHEFSSGTPSGNKPPIVSITAPGTGSSLTSPASITITASASDVDGTISKVAFYNGSTKLSESTTSPYSYTWSNVATGNYSLTVVATDNSNSATTSSPVIVIVNNPTTTDNPPVVNITGPSNGGSYTAPASCQISANASDADGTISKVEFFSGSTKLGESSTLPYTYTWSNVPAGTYSLTAVATDNLNSKTTSSAVTITVSNQIPSGNTPPSITITSPSSSSSFTAPASITITANATDADGTISKVEFFSGSTKLGESTTSPYSFTWSNVAAGTYSLTAVATDNLNSQSSSSAINVIVNGPVAVGAGATFYQNGNFSGTSVTLPAGNYTASQIGSMGLSDNNISSLKVNGYEVVAFKNDNFSGDQITFTTDQSSLSGTGWNDQITSVKILAQANNLLVVSISAPGNGLNFSAPASIQITANASDANGTISKVEFFNGSTKLGESTTSPYSFTWNDVAFGTYQITAVATDNLNAQATSTVVTVYVNNDGAITSVPSSGSFGALNVYPNPTDGHFSIGSLNSQQDDKVRILVMDLSGKVVYSENLAGNETTKDFDLTNIKAGTYIINVIYDKNRSVSRKFVKF